MAMRPVASDPRKGNIDMKSSVREFQSAALGASAAAQFSPVNGQRFTSVRQALTALRDEDPAFDKSISTHRFERGATVASPEDLSKRMFVLMSGQRCWQPKKNIRFFTNRIFIGTASVPFLAPRLLSTPWRNTRAGPFVGNTPWNIRWNPVLLAG